MPFGVLFSCLFLFFRYNGGLRGEDAPHPPPSFEITAQRRKRVCAMELNNVRFLDFDAAGCQEIFSPGEVDRIYINFCNPWPKPRHKKRRLTHTRQLEKYKQFLKKNGEIYFKTDDDGLFKESLEYFEEVGFKITKITYDLNEEPNFWDNIETEHEIKFKNEGIKIKAGIFRLS